MTMGPTPIASTLFELKLEAVKVYGAYGLVEAASLELNSRHSVA
jgi:hypothetical protein